jgi:Conjugal transfer protein TrbH
MRNIHSTLLMLLCMSVAACAGLPQPTRNEPGNPAFEERIATDTVNQIARLYPPARTQLNVVSTPDSFGALLAAKLRGRGFGVAETIEAKPKVLPFTFNDDFRMSPDVAADQENKPARAAAGFELRYQLEVAKEVKGAMGVRGAQGAPADSLSRITVTIGSAVLARAYLSDNNDPGAVAAAGAWTYRAEK